jgi:myo-inositol-1-phosphate synthase
MSVRVGIIGQGYVASTLALGLARIRSGEIGLSGVPLRNLLKSYRVEDVEVVCSLDVDYAKVGRTLGEVVKMYYPEARSYPSLDSVTVSKGIHLGSTGNLPIKAVGLEEELGLEEAIYAIVGTWERCGVDVLVNLITTEYTEPVESLHHVRRLIREGGKLPATYAYLYAATVYAETVKPVAFINAIPATVARSRAFVKAFEERRSVVLGDDGASGATPLTSDLLEHLAERNRIPRGVVQFNIGGNLDFLALLDESRNKAKERTKSSVVADVLGFEVPSYIKPTGFSEYLGDKKFVSMHIEYVGFNGAVDEITVNARINDSPALAGLLVDLVRLAKIALDRGFSGTIYEVNAFYMKSPGPEGSKSISRIVAYQILIDWLLRIGELTRIPRYSVHNFIPELRKAYGLE